MPVNTVKIMWQLNSDIYIQHNLPHDTVFTIEGWSNVHGVFDPLDLENLARSNSYWYAMNHSTQPNVKSYVVSDHNGDFLTVGFKAIRHVNVHDELRYNYVEPDRDWDD
jgi:hypothetical protein